MPPRHPTPRTRAWSPSPRSPTPTSHGVGARAGRSSTTRARVPPRPLCGGCDARTSIVRCEPLERSRDLRPSHRARPLTARAFVVFLVAFVLDGGGRGGFRRRRRRPRWGWVPRRRARCSLSRFVVAVVLRPGKPWWNPAVENQAMQRAHRIGQTREVVATRFVTKGSIEERMYELQAKKQLVFEGTVDGKARGAAVVVGARSRRRREIDPTRARAALALGGPLLGVVVRRRHLHVVRLIPPCRTASRVWVSSAPRLSSTGGGARAAHGRGPPVPLPLDDRSAPPPSWPRRRRRRVRRRERHGASAARACRATNTFARVRRGMALPGTRERQSGGAIGGAQLRFVMV